MFVDAVARLPGNDLLGHGGDAVRLNDLAQLRSALGLWFLRCFCHSRFLLMLFAEAGQQCRAAWVVNEIVQRFRAIRELAGLDQEIGSPVRGMVVGGACDGLVDRRFFVVAVGLVIGGESLIPIFHEALARNTAHVLLALLELIVLAHVFFVLARGDGGLLFVPVRLVDVVIVGAGVALRPFVDVEADIEGFATDRTKPGRKLTPRCRKHAAGRTTAIESIRLISSLPKVGELRNP